MMDIATTAREAAIPPRSKEAGLPCRFSVIRVRERPCVSFACSPRSSIRKNSVKWPGKRCIMSEEYTRMKANQHEQGLIRVVVVDDHQVVREGLRMMLEILGEGFVMVGEAADGASALRVVKEAQPD